MSLVKKLKDITPTNQPRTSPLWKGPESDDPQGGITFSLLSRFLVCRERFRLYAVEGLAIPRTWNHRIGFGNMWHVCEEAFAKGWKKEANLQLLTEYCRELCKQHPLQQPEIVKYYEVCKRMFPVYVDYWAKHKDVTNRTPLLQEQVFNVPYKLPSGRVVRLRGKWDSVDLVKEVKQCPACKGKKGFVEGGRYGTCATCDGKGVRSSSSVWLQENKTKGDIDEQQLQRQLKFDLQTMIYMVALYSYNWTGETKSTTVAKKPFPIKGVRYNVIRRPFSGGRGSIRQHKPTKSNPQGETEQQLYDRLLTEYVRPEPEYWFMRWNVEVTPQDVEIFRREFLDPCLENLCYWYDDVVLKTPLPRIINKYCFPPVHWRHPFGVFNIMDEGGSTEYDSYLETGNMVGLERVEKLFTELEA